MGASRIAGVGRHGIPGYEKAALVAEDCSRRDLSILVTELDGTFFSGQWWSALDGLDVTTLPLVAAGARIAPCLERPSALLLARARTGQLVNVTGIDMAGAHDPLPRSEGTLACTAGIAAIVGGRGSDGRVGAAGFCCFLLVATEVQCSDGPFYLGDSTVYLGPLVVAPDVERPLVLTLTVGANEAGQYHIAVPPEAMETALASLGVDHAVPGAMVLVGAGETAAIPRADANLLSIRLDGGPLGEQAHALSTASAS